jgi:hypothetical protein
MQVIAHQAERMNPVTEADDAFCKQIVKVPTVCGRQEYVLTRISAKDDVVQTPWDMNSRLASHEGKHT